MQRRVERGVTKLTVEGAAELSALGILVSGYLGFARSRQILTPDHEQELETVISTIEYFGKVAVRQAAGGSDVLFQCCFVPPSVSLIDVATLIYRRHPAALERHMTDEARLGPRLFFLGADLV